MIDLEKHTHPWLDGWGSCEKGIKSYNNPYSWDSQNFSAAEWLRGWEARHQEEEPRYDATPEAT